MKLCEVCKKSLTEKQEKLGGRFCSIICANKDSRRRKYNYGYSITFLDDPTDFRDYFIGLWVADGNQWLPAKRITITNSNRHLIDQLVEYTNYTNVVITQKIEGEKTKYHLAYTSPINDKFVELGYNFGKKTGKEFIPIQIYNFASFLRGYFDGDGCFNLQKKRQGHLHAFIGCANRKFLEDILDRLHKENIVIGGAICKRKDKEFYELIFGHADAIKLGYYMYHDKMTAKLEYKYYLWKTYKDTEVKEYDKYKICSVPGCNEPHSGRGLCHTHYNQEYYVKPRTKRRQLKRMVVKLPEMLNKILQNNNRDNTNNKFEKALINISSCSFWKNNKGLSL